MEPDSRFMEGENYQFIILNPKTLKFQEGKLVNPHWGNIDRPDYLKKINLYRDSYLQNRLEIVELKEFINNLICHHLYHDYGSHCFFWNSTTFERDFYSWQYIFPAISEFLLWLSETGRYFNYRLELNDRIKLYLSKYPNDALNYQVLEEKLEDIDFFKALKHLIDIIYRESDWHKEEIDRCGIIPYVEPENRISFDKKLAQKRLEYESLSNEIEEMKLQRIKMEQLNREFEELLATQRAKANLFDEEVYKKAEAIVDERLPHELEKIKENNHKNILDNLFGDIANTLSNSDMFEKEEAERERRKRLEEIERREFKTEIREQINEHGKTIYEAKSEFRDYTSAHGVEHANERADNRIAFERLDAKIEKVKIEADIRFIKVESESEKRYIQLESGMQVLKSYVENFDITINARIDKEISTVGHAIADLKISIKESFMSVEKEFGVRDIRFKEEILNLNENQMKIVGYLEILKNQTENFKQQIQNEMSRALIEIDRKGLTFEEVRATASQLLERTEILYRGIQVENGGLKNKLEASLGELELGKKSMFVELSKQKLVLEKATQDVYHTAKEVAYGKLDIELLHSEKQQRLNESQGQLNSTLQEIRMKEQEMKSFWANESTRNRLENQLSLLHERSQIEKSHLERRAEEAEFVVRRLRDKNLAY